MAWYTTQVKTICEVNSNLEEGTSYTKTIPLAIPKIFDFEFPIFDESYRNVLCTKILKRYYMKEIAHETVGLWKLRLDSVLNEIMPYYNQLYKSCLLEFNPLYDVDLIRTSNKTGNNIKTGNQRRSGTITDDGNVKENFTTNQDSTNDNTNKVTNVDDFNNTRTLTGKNETDANNTTTSNKKDKVSDTPQGGLVGLENDTYLTKAQIVDDTVSDKGSTVVNVTDKETNTDKRTVNTDGTNKDIFSSTTTGNNTTTKTNLNTNESQLNETENISTLDEYLETVKGKQGAENYSSLLLKFRETFLNIDAMILDDLSTLFFGIWDFQGGSINGGL